MIAFAGRSGWVRVLFSVNYCSNLTSLNFPGGGVSAPWPPLDELWVQTTMRIKERSTWPLFKPFLFLTKIHKSWRITYPLTIFWMYKNVCNVFIRIKKKKRFNTSDPARPKDEQLRIWVVVVHPPPPTTSLRFWKTTLYLSDLERTLCKPRFLKYNAQEFVYNWPDSF